ncbi:MAG: endolytic transglycosylase MltG [Oscillospiraceae bacterium]|jgi:UPF0755 protein|nr:endolytic transglycosylase MltG [Oscillospiraceae bacterium]
MDNEQRTTTSGDTKPLPNVRDLPRNSGQIPTVRRESAYTEETFEVSDREAFVSRNPKRRFGLLGGLMYAVFILAVSVVLAALLWMAANDVIALDKEFVQSTITIDALPYDRVKLMDALKAKIEAVNEAAKEKNEALISIYVPSTATVDQMLSIYDAQGWKPPYEPFDFDELVDDLQSGGIINYKALFRLYATVSHAESKIQPGTYELDTTLDYRAIVTAMRKGSGSRPVVEGVLLTEGMLARDMFKLLEKEGICTEAELWKYIKRTDFAPKYSFLQDLPADDQNKLEGFLFPDTYDFYRNSSAEEVVRKLLNNFDVKYTEALREAVAASGFSPRQVLTIASLIEAEAANDKERPVVASVIFNRLNNWDNPLLQLDASIQYALPAHKTVLTASDLQLDSPYNTYLYAGLTPGPICNPGLASIKAVLNPETTKYYYYALNKDGVHQFFATQGEHEAFVASPDFVLN